MLLLSTIKNIEYEARPSKSDVSLFELLKSRRNGKIQLGKIKSSAYTNIWNLS